MANGEEGPAQRVNNSEVAPEKKYLVWGYGAVVVAAIIALVLSWISNVQIEASEGFAPFAVIYIIAQAIERVLQPFTTFTVGAQEKSEAKNELKKAKSKRAAALTLNEAGTAASETEKAAAEQKKLEQIHADRSLVYWAAATSLALLVCGALKLGLIQSVAHLTNGGGLVRDIDVIVTGIAVGSGTKPLHDVISVIKSTKQKAETAPATG